MPKGATTSNELFKIPYDVTTEQILVAAALQDSKVLGELTARIRPEQFQDSDLAVSWGLIKRLHEQGHSPTVNSVVKLSGGKLNATYLNDICSAFTTTPPDLRFHIEALQWDSTRIKAVNGPVTELLKALNDPTTSPERIRALARQLPVSFQGGGSRTHLRDSDRLVAEHRDTLLKRKQGVALFPTGIDGLDFYPPDSVDDDGADVSGEPLLVPGFEPGKITTVTAISGGGKSTFVAKLALEQARICSKRGHGKVLYGAWEMSPHDTLELMACISLGIQRKRVKTGQISDAELVNLCATMEAIAEWVRFVDMPFHKERGVRHTHDEVLDEIHGYIADSGATIAFFDLWRRAFRRLKDEADESEALYRQQAIAEETGCHCVLVQQQRLKDIETRANPAPTREGIKGSSAWVDISDTILGVYLPGLMKRVARNVIQVLVLKQRFGRWPLVIEYVWDGDLVRMTKPQLVWDMAIGDETRAQSGGASGRPSKSPTKDLSKLTQAAVKAKQKKER
jgi:KaiC/GvpD/RAD55 family RecA-like ATPase